MAVSKFAPTKTRRADVRMAGRTRATARIVFVKISRLWLRALNKAENVEETLMNSRMVIFLLNVYFASPQPGSFRGRGRGTRRAHAAWALRRQAWTGVENIRGLNAAFRPAGRRRNFRIVGLLRTVVSSGRRRWIAKGGAGAHVLDEAMPRVG
jgi:hypothetical protein